MLSIVIPAHNEESRIGKTLEEYSKFFKKKKKDKEIKNFEIIVVLNGCVDNTLGVVRKYKKRYSEIKILDFKQAGKGFAIKKGFEYALKNKKNKNELIGFVDADMSTKPEAYLDLVKNIKNYDGIIASRYIKGSVVRPKQPFARILASRVFNFLVRSLFFIPYRDTQCGAKLFKRKATEVITKEMGLTEWAFDIDLLYISKRRKLKIREFPTIWRDRKGSGLNLKKVGVQMFFSIIQLRILYSPFKKTRRIFELVISFLYKLVK